MKNLPMLKDLHIRITSNCNFNCLHCYAGDWLNEKYELEFEDIKSLIDQAIELGCQKVTFTGGEPLIARCIVESINYSLYKNLKVEVESNGVFVDKVITGFEDEKIRKVKFAISYDGEKIRDKKFTRQVRDNILKLKKLGCDVKIQTVITKINIDEFDDIFQFSRDNEIKNRCFLAHSPNGNGKNLSLFATNEWLKIIKIVKEKYPQAIIELPDVLSGRMQKKCGWGVHRCEIMPNGDVTSCAPITFNKRDFVAGNIKTQKLKDIWASQHFTYIRNLKQSDYELPCSKCIYWKTCLGSCRSLSYANGHTLFAPHPFCKALYNSIKKDEIDKELILDNELVEAWIKGIEDDEFKPVEKLYEILVKEQHLNAGS